MYKEIYAHENYIQGKKCNGEFFHRKIVYWENVYKEICVMENYVQGKICTE